MQIVQIGRAADARSAAEFVESELQHMWRRADYRWERDRDAAGDRADPRASCDHDLLAARAGAAYGHGAVAEHAAHVFRQKRPCAAQLAVIRSSRRGRPRITSRCREIPRVEGEGRSWRQT
ncbi:hypothetical protein FI667_g7352, partial [Globisporangium splendens]